MSYKNFLQKKVDQAREQIQAGQCRSNEEVAAEFAKLRAELANCANSTNRSAASQGNN